MTKTTTEHIVDFLKLSQSFVRLFNFLFHFAIFTILPSLRRNRIKKAIKLLSMFWVGHAFASFATFDSQFNERANLIIIAGLAYYTRPFFICIVNHKRNSGRRCKDSKFQRSCLLTSCSYYHDGIASCYELLVL